MGVTGLPSDDAVLRAVLEHDGASLDGRAARDDRLLAPCPSLIAGRVDAVVAFWNAEGVTLRRRGVRHARVPRRTATARRATPSWCWPPRARRSTSTATSCATRWPRCGTARARRSRDPPTAVSEVAKASGEDEARGARAVRRPSAGVQAAAAAATATRWGVGPLRRALRDPEPPARPRPGVRRAARRSEPLHQRGGLARHARARHHAVHAGRLGRGATSTSTWE